MKAAAFVKRGSILERLQRKGSVVRLDRILGGVGYIQMGEILRFVGIIRYVGIVVTSMYYICSRKSICPQEQRLYKAWEH